jgi:NTE family protein
MFTLRFLALLAVAAQIALAGCATRPVNPPMAKFEPKPYQYARPDRDGVDRNNLIILAFSGGGTRAAAFSFGVLEALRSIEVERGGQRGRLLDEVDAITGVSGGSFTALAYGLYGEKLFDTYEKQFLKRNVQGELIARFFNPFNWPALDSVGRSELAANLYDEILFNGATFADLYKAGGPLIAASATDIESGSRIVFIPNNFDVLCADLGPMRIARAAASSSAVPVVLSPITINNYAGTCGYRMPDWTARFLDNPNPPRPAARVLQRLQELRSFEAGRQPYLHLVDGGVSDNVGLRGVLDLISLFEAFHEAGLPTPLDRVKRIVVFVVNSLSSPTTDWNEREQAPGPVQVLVKAAGVPIDRYSGESVELLKDIAARWQSLRMLRESIAFARSDNEAVRYVQRAPNADLYAIDVSFPRLKDAAERDYLNNLPTSFVLPDEAVDRLRAASRKIILDSPDFQQVLKDAGVRIVDTRP